MRLLRYPFRTDRPVVVCRCCVDPVPCRRPGLFRRHEFGLVRAQSLGAIGVRSTAIRMATLRRIGPRPGTAIRSAREFWRRLGSASRSRFRIGARFRPTRPGAARSGAARAGMARSLWFRRACADDAAASREERDGHGWKEPAIVAANRTANQPPVAAAGEDASRGEGRRRQSGGVSERQTGARQSGRQQECQR